ncbi:MAG: hypothetical protein H7210_04300 [Pyrinomonadaceae bacterium]|nr:hypothetical protein [Phycisphaerales bacterium]
MAISTANTDEMDPQPTGGPGPGGGAGFPGPLSETSNRAEDAEVDASYNQAMSQVGPSDVQLAAGGAGGIAVRRKRSFLDRVEAYISRLSTKNNFWHRVTSLIWLPFAFRSGIKMKRVDAATFTALLPFRRFNRNWYNAMAGAALLGNSEIAGGMYVFGVCGGDYTVVCKHLEYKFLRPCFGPALYRISPKEDINALIASGKEFNITINMDVCQQIGKPGDREKRVGKSTAIFHVTPKTHQKKKRERGKVD